MNRVCFIIPGLNAGGVENYLLRFLNFYNKLEGITVIAVDRKKGDLYDEYKKLPISVQFQNVGYINPVKWIKLFLLFKKNRFETVCILLGNFSGIPVTIAKMAGIKNRITFYRRSSNAFRKTFGRQIYNKLINKLVFYNSTKILSNSKTAIEFFFPYRKKSDLRFKVISNGINADSFIIKDSRNEARSKLNMSFEAFIVGHIGRFDPAKNHDTIFKVAKRLHKIHENVVFVFCGKGTDSDLFADKLRENSIEKFSVCLGLQKNIPLVLKTMDLFYFPSVTEGQPNALLEAIWSGLPVLTSDILPIKEILPEDLHTNLLSPFDVNSAVSVISGIIKGKIKISKYNYRERIENNFNDETNFNDFLNELQ